MSKILIWVWKNYGVSVEYNFPNPNYLEEISYRNFLYAKQFLVNNLLENGWYKKSPISGSLTSRLCSLLSLMDLHILSSVTKYTLRFHNSPGYPIFPIHQNCWKNLRRLPPEFPSPLISRSGKVENSRIVRVTL